MIRLEPEVRHHLRVIQIQSYREGLAFGVTIGILIGICVCGIIFCAMRLLGIN